LVAGALAACQSEGPAARKNEPPPVALVNGAPITVSTFQQELTRAKSDTGDGEVPLDTLRKRVLDDVVERTLLLQEARSRSVAVGQDQVERAFLRVRSEYPGTHFDDMLAQERLSAADLKTRLRDQLVVEKLFQDEVFASLQVTEDEQQRYYNEHAAEFEEPERVRVLQVVSRTKEEAQKVRDEARRKPSAFSEIAKRHSIAPEGRSGGDLGYFGKGSGMPEVFDVCFKMPLNQVSEVTPSPYGFHVFKVVDRKSPSKRPFVSAKEEIVAKLLREKRAKAQTDYVGNLKSKAQVKVDDKALATVTPR
jgi:peptidyl-prolyl cis-trans isomerase C